MSKISAQKIIDLTPIPMIIVNDTGEILELNNSFIQTFSFQLNELNEAKPSWLCKLTVFQHCPVDSASFLSFLKHTEKQTVGKKPLEVDIYSKSNKLHTILLSVSSLGSHQYLMVLYDITEHKQLRQDSNRLHHSVAASINEIYMFDANTLNFSFANDSALNNLGYTMAELREMRPFDILPAFSIDKFKKMLLPLANQDKHGQSFETMIQRKRGSIYDVEVHLQFFIAEGAPSYFLAIIIDISEKKQLEAKISTLVAAANVILWSTDKRLSINYISDQASDILKSDTSSVIGQNLLSLVNSNRIQLDDRKMLLDAIEKMQHQHLPVKNIEIQVNTGSKQRSWLSISMTPIYDTNKRLQQVVGVIHGLSAQKQTQAQLRVLNKELDDRVKHEVAENRTKDLMLQQQGRMVAMGEMIGNIAHQWRQPLNSLAIILMELEDSFLYGDATTESINRSIKLSNALLQKMSHTIDDFRNFFKNDKPLSENRLQDIVAESVNLLESSLNHHQIELTTHIMRYDVLAIVHPGELSQTILCLTNNARDQILSQQIEQGKIVIEIDQNDEWAIIRIKDNGGGINENDLPKIFDPYFTSKPDGCGLGLYITQLTVQESMSGNIAVENKDDGAQFSLFLPKPVNQS